MTAPNKDGRLLLRWAILGFVIGVVVASVVAFIDKADGRIDKASRYEPVAATAASSPQGGGVDARICYPTYPDFPGCSKQQVKSIAIDDRVEWWKKAKFGDTNVLEATNLTANQKERVRDALETEITQILRRMESKAKVPPGKVWTTNWRGESYTLASFPVKRYVRDALEGNGGDNYGACWVGNRASTDGATMMSDFYWAMQYCRALAVPPGWDSYWQPVVEKLNEPGGGRFDCNKEVVLGATGGGVTSGLMGLVFGPGAVPARAMGAIAGGTGAGATCIVDNLGVGWGWWD